MEEKTIYDLCLHEILETENLKITRVPWWWIYISKVAHIGNLDWNNVKYLNTFVPFDNEFMPRY